MFDQEIPRATVVDGNLISNVGDEDPRGFTSIRSGRMGLGGSKGMSGDIR